jgi:hypothetical protein
MQAFSFSRRSVFLLILAGSCCALTAYGQTGVAQGWSLPWTAAQVPALDPAPPATPWKITWSKLAAASNPSLAIRLDAPVSTNLAVPNGDSGTSAPVETSGMPDEPDTLFPGPRAIPEPARSEETSFSHYSTPLPEAPGGDVAFVIIAPPKNLGPGIPPSAVGDLDYNETTGIIDVPAAKVAPAGSIMTATEFQDTTFPGVGLYSSKTTGPRPYDDANALFQNAGDSHILVGLGGGLELSVMGLHASFNALIFGAKYLVQADGEDHPAFAVGVQSIDLRPQFTYAHPAFFDVPNVFGVVGHTFALNDDEMSLELEAGLGTGRLRAGFGGAEFHFNRNVGIAADYDGNVASLALKLNPSDRTQILLDTQMQTPVRFGVSVRHFWGARESRRAPEWALHRDKSHVPEPDVLLLPETDHTTDHAGEQTPKP